MSTTTIAEYRALRASVLRLWKDAHGFAADDFDDMLRFNESIDQAIAESVASFEAHVERARNLLLGMLGHDMRSLLGAIRATAECLEKLNAGSELSKPAVRLISSGRSMKSLLDDLVDFNRTRLGLGIRIHPDALWQTDAGWTWLTTCGQVLSFDASDWATGPD